MCWAVVKSAIICHPQSINTSFCLIITYQQSTDSVDFITTKFYNKVTRLFQHHIKEKKWSGYTRQGKGLVTSIHSLANQTLLLQVGHNSNVYITINCSCFNCEYPQNFNCIFSPLFIKLCTIKEQPF